MRDDGRMNDVLIGLAVTSTLIAIAALTTRHRSTFAAALAAMYLSLAPVEAGRPGGSVVAPLFLGIAGLHLLLVCTTRMQRRRPR